MNITRGKILLIPMPIGPNSLDQMLNEFYLEALKQTKYWVVENARTTRRFLSSLKLGIDLNGLEMIEIGKHNQWNETLIFLNEHIKKGDIGVTSEAGLPGMADPGELVAKWAHTNNVGIVPLIGPGSIYLSLCASGFNG